MRLSAPILLASLAVILSQAPQAAEGQGKGGGKGQGGGQGENKGKGKGGNKDKDKVEPQRQAKGQGRGEGRGKNNVDQLRPRSRNERAVPTRGADRGRSVKHKFTRVASPNDMPQSVRHFATSRRAHDVIVAAAVSHAFARGHGDDIRVVQVGNGMRLANRKGDNLVFLDEESARNLGRWRVGVIDDEPREGGPSFCRSGEGHPVWGRQWCLDKGFGLGAYQDFRWARTHDVGDLVFSPGTFGNSLVGNALASVLGTTAFNRLALHAVTLGLVEPLIGRWYSEPTGSQVLLVNSGVLPVAELVDVNRDNRADNMLVALRSW